MTAVRVEAKAFTDPRIAALAAVAKYEVDEAIGRLTRLWLWCTEKETYCAPAWLVWSVMRVSDEDFVRLDLGEWADDQKKLIRIKGTKGRIEWLSERRAASKAGGETTKQLYSDQRKLKNSQTIAKEGAKREPNGSPLTLTLPLSLLNQRSEIPLNPPLKSPGRPKKPKLGEPTDDERAVVHEVLKRLGARNGVSYSGSKTHVALIVGRLRDGYSEMDLRKVIGYVAQLWASKPDMQQYLRPETLFGPTTIARYIDAARAWFETLPKESPQ